VAFGSTVALLQSVRGQSQEIFAAFCTTKSLFLCAER
jgi:hypothetical protein